MCLLKGHFLILHFSHQRRKGVVHDTEVLLLRPQLEEGLDERLAQAGGHAGLDGLEQVGLGAVGNGVKGRRSGVGGIGGRRCGGGGSG